MAYHKITDIDRRKIMRFHKKGYFNEAIARIIGCAPATVHRVLKSKNLASHFRPGNDIKVNTPAVVTLYRQGLSLATISQRLGIPFHTVVNAIHYYRQSHSDLPYRDARGRRPAAHRPDTSSSASM